MSTRTLWYAVNKELVKKQVPVPTLDAGEVLVKVKAIAFNPTDYKHLDLGIAQNSGLGCDFSGDIAEVGSGVSLVKVGDTVSGMISGGNDERPERGSFSDFVKVHETQVFKFNNLKFDGSKEIPAGIPTTYEQAASLGACLATTAFAYESYNRWDISKKNSQSGYALIYGGVSSLGFMVGQVAKYLGFNVIAVASSKHKDLLKLAGISHVVDYHDEDWVEQARKIGGDDIVYAYDTISFADTLSLVCKAVSTTKPVKINVSLPGTPEPENLGKNITIDAPLTYLMSDPYKIFGPRRIEGEPHFMKDAPTNIAHANKLLAEGVITALPVTVVGEGIDAVPAGVNAIRKGVSGEKVVITL